MASQRKHASTEGRERFKTAVYLVVGVSLFVFGLWRAGGDRRAEPAIGQYIRPFEVESSSGRQFALNPGRWTFLIAGPSESEILLERSARLAASLAPMMEPRIVFLASDKDHRAEPRPGIEVFHHREFGRDAFRSLGLGAGGRHFLLLSPDLEVTFQSRFLRAQDLDLLFRKYLGLEVHASVPITLRDLPILDSNGRTTAPEGPCRWIVFHRGCSSCGLEADFSQLVADRERLAQLCRSAGGQCSLVVDPALDDDRLREDLAARKLELPVLRVQGLDRLVEQSSTPINSKAFMAWFGPRGELVRQVSLKDALREVAPGDRRAHRLVTGASVTELPEPKVLPVLSITDLEIEPGSGKLWVLDGESHNLRAFEDGAPSFSVGSIGNQPGDLFYPEEFQLLPGGGFAIFDAGNERVQVFDRGGRVQREVRPKTKAVGLAVTSTDDSLLGEPATEALVARYRADGGPLSSVGTLRHKEESASPQARLGKNRVHLQVGVADELWITFLHELRVQKYSADGRLLLDLDLTLPLREHGVSPDVERLPRLNTDGETLPVLIVDSSYQPIRDWLWLLLGDGAIVGLQPSGELGFVGRLQSPLPFGQIAASPGAAVALTLGEFSGGRILEIDFPSTQTWLD